VALKNVELTVTDIRRRSPVLMELETSGAIKIVRRDVQPRNGHARVSS